MSNKIEHIALIMDGNNRWSKIRKTSLYDSYYTGAKTLYKLSTKLFNEQNIKFVSAFALSVNNLNRSKSLILTLKKVLNKFLDSEELKNRSFNIMFKGNLNFLDKKTIEKIINLEKNNIFQSTLIIFLNYGGREDIYNAFLSYKSRRNRNLSIDNFLITRKIPDPDILVRTGGYQRLSNFLLYQVAFTELFFSKKLWPNFNYSDLRKIINKYYKIERKFGL